MQCELLVLKVPTALSVEVEFEAVAEEVADEVANRLGGMDEMDEEGVEVEEDDDDEILDGEGLATQV